MSMHMSSNQKSTGNCGCGRGTHTDPCGCGCTAASADCGCNEGVLVRPNFFAGQLLTDEDLQTLNNYVVTKQRLHNRFLVGNGVSCGLAVTCHPCGGGRVLVQPGYAVDCCGNEILVPCPVELDINGMVRDLKFSRLGTDCGDPCPEPLGKESVADESSAQRSATNTVARHDDGKSSTKRYCLYINYCEEPSDPVAPYTQDDSCAVSCQPSRIREGFSFELRCPTEEPDPPSIVDRIRCCIGDLGEADRKAADFERSQYHIQRSRVAIDAYRHEITPQFSGADAKLLMTESEALGGMHRVSPASTSSSGDTAGKGDDEKALRRSLDRMHALGAATARFYAQDKSTQDKLLEQHEGLAARLEANQALFKELAPALAKRADAVLQSSLERSLAQAVADSTLKYTDPQLPMMERRDAAGYMYAYDSVSSPSAANQMNNSLARFKSWLLRKMDECPPLGECGLVREVEAIVIPTEDDVSEAWTRATDQLVRAFLRYLIDCICAALLPPCPSCEDPAVKLACLDVIDCEVDNICNLERTFLLTEHNLRYWIPLLHQLGEAFEAACCTLAKRLDKPLIRSEAKTRDEVVQQQQQWQAETAYFTGGQQVGATVASNEVFPKLIRIAGLSPQTVGSVINLGGNTARLTARDPIVNTLLAREDLSVIGRDVGAKTLASAFELPPAKEALKRATEQEFARVEERIDLLSANATRLADDASKRFNERLREVENEIGKRVTSSGLAQTNVIRELRDRLQEQLAETKTLTQRLAKLEKETKS